jgi:hypothetical protein
MNELKKVEGKAMREIRILTDGSNIHLEKADCTRLELMSILNLLLNEVANQKEEVKEVKK